MGIEVIYLIFESNEEMYFKLKFFGLKGYDIVFLLSYYVGKMVKEGMLVELDKFKFSNLKNVMFEFMYKLFDFENKYFLFYVYGLIGIGVNVVDIDLKIISSWGDLWCDEYKGKLLLMNDLCEVFYIVLLLNGKLLNIENEEEIKVVYECLKMIVLNVLVFNLDLFEMFYL